MAFEPYIEVTTKDSTIRSYFKEGMPNEEVTITIWNSKGHQSDKVRIMCYENSIFIDKVAINQELK